MREIASGVFLEGKFPGVHVGAVASDGQILLVDCPLRTEDGKEWLGHLAGHGRPKYLVLLDHNPDRVLGARGFDLPIVGHNATREAMDGWQDTFKGMARPIGCEADRLKRITGVSKATPELTFQEEMVLHVGRREVQLRHRPGPTAGSIWVVVPETKVIFLGDTVAVTEPPFLGEADPEEWLRGLEELRRSEFRGYRLVSSRDGVVDLTSVAQMARFLRRVMKRLVNLGKTRAPAEAAGALSKPFAKSFRVSPSRRDQALVRLEIGLARLYSRVYL